MDRIFLAQLPPQRMRIVIDKKSGVRERVIDIYDDSFRVKLVSAANSPADSRNGKRDAELVPLAVLFRPTASIRQPPAAAVL
jgi:hypothetical protein